MCLYSCLRCQYLFQSLPGRFLDVDLCSCDMFKRCEEMVTDVQGKALDGFNLVKDSVM